MTANRFAIPLLSAVLSLALAGCPDDEDPITPDGGTVADAGNGDDAGTDGGNNNQIPAKPTLGAQIDRMGRPAANTAVNNTFNTDMTATDTAKDAYNAAAPSAWAGFSGEIAANLAIYDALDGVCGNQLLAGMNATAGRYDTLAGVLADDRLYVNSASTTCTQYLAVEANAVGVMNDDCGGRTLSMDVIDTTYSVVAVGALTGVTDGVAADGDGASVHSATEFPFVGAPQ